MKENKEKHLNTNIRQSNVVLTSEVGYLKGLKLHFKHTLTRTKKVDWSNHLLYYLLIDIIILFYYNPSLLSMFISLWSLLNTNLLLLAEWDIMQAILQTDVLLKDIVRYYMSETRRLGISTVSWIIKLRLVK